MLNKNSFFLLLFAFIIMKITPAIAQLNPLSTQYFINEYLINPALAGKDKGATVQGTYRKQWSGIPGAPVTQNITADFGFQRVGLGLNINNESAGLLRQTRAIASYAYHLPIDSGKHQLHFGLSLGLMNQRLENTAINGNPDDIAVGDYNGQRSYIDGDFGIAYTSGSLNMQLAVPNMKNFFNRDMRNVADIVTFYSAVSYLFDVYEQITLEPKLAYMGIRNFKNRVDLGMQVSFAAKQVSAMGMYHGNESATFGAGLKLSDHVMISGMYTTQTAALNSYINGSFEMNLKFRFRN